MNKVSVRLLPINPIKLLWTQLIVEISRAFLSKSQWAVHLFLIKYMQVCGIHNFFLEEDVSQATVGFFNNTRHFTLYQINLLGVKRDVGRILVMADAKTFDLTYIGSCTELSPQQLQDVQSMLYLVASSMSSFFEDMDYTISPEIDSFDIRMSKLKVIDLMHAQRAGALNLKG